jgi:RNA polymerase sigma-70 factor (ECF subfamily)
VLTDPSELLREVQGLRRLAQRLARDGATAEDLLQELSVRAWKDGPPQPERRGPWLVSVLRNLSRKQHRGEQRRLRREQRHALAGHSRSTSSASEVAERIEAQRLLLDALADLEEPFRSTLVLRYQDDLAPVEIARRSGVPAGTVRWRIHEGLIRLRARLDTRHGGREAWLQACGPLLLPANPLAPVSAVAPAAGPVLFGIAMNTTLKVGLAAAALGLVAVPVWLATRSEPVLSAPRKDPRASETLASELREAPGDDVLSAASGERALVVESDLLDSPRSSTPPEAPPVARIEGRVLDEWLRPLDSARAEAAEPLATAECDAAGRFALELALEQDHEPGLEVRLHAPGHASQVVRVSARLRETVQLGDVQLAAGARVVGRVTTSAGDPAPDIQVVVARPRADPTADDLSGPLLEPESASATSDARGWFEIDGAPAGMVSAWARLPSADASELTERSSWVRSEVFELAAGGAREGLVLTLPLSGGFAPTAIAGRVTSPLGKAVPRASLRVRARIDDNGRASTVVTTIVAGDDGRFLYDPQSASVVELVASDPEKTLRPARVAGIRGGSHDVEIELGEPRWLELAVRVARGAPPAQFEVREFRTLPDGKEDWSSTHAGAQGALRLSVPIDPFRLEVVAPGCALLSLGPFEPEQGPTVLECELEPLPGLRGRVTYEGAPVAGARLELRRYPAPKQHVERNGFPMKVWCEVEETALSGADGSFLLTGRQAGQRVIQCLADGFALAELGPLDVDPARGAGELALELARGGAIEGRVLAAPGVDPAGIIVAANRFDGHPRTARADEQGRFRFERLTPGPWRIERVKSELDPANDGYMVDDAREIADPRSVANCSVTDGRTTEFVLDLTNDRPARLELRLAVDGAPAAGWSIVLWPVGVNTFEGELPGGRLDDDGRLSCEVEAGRYSVRFQDGESSAFHGVAEIELELPPGATPLEVAFETASLAGRYSGDPADLIAVWSAQSPAGCRTQTYIVLDAQGRFARDVVLAGNGELRIERRGGKGVVVTRELDLQGGQTANVELP